MSSQSPAASPSPKTTTTTGPLNNASALLLGFLVSALSVFAVFMTIAIIWNRLVARRRAIDAMMAVNPHMRPQWPHRPMMWDVRAASDKQPCLWADVKPVTVQESDSLASSSLATQTTQTISSWRNRLLDHLPPEITYLFRRPIPYLPAGSGDTEIPRVELSHGSNVQISLLICMPRAPHSKQGRRLHEMAFGTTNVVYDGPDLP